MKMTATRNFTERYYSAIRIAILSLSTIRISEGKFMVTKILEVSLTHRRISSIISTMVSGIVLSFSSKKQFHLIIF